MSVCDQGADFTHKDRNGTNTILQGRKNHYFFDSILEWERSGFKIGAKYSVVGRKVNQD